MVNTKKNNTNKAVGSIFEKLRGSDVFKFFLNTLDVIVVTSDTLQLDSRKVLENLLRNGALLVKSVTLNENKYFESSGDDNDGNK